MRYILSLILLLYFLFLPSSAKSQYVHLERLIDTDQKTAQFQIDHLIQTREGNELFYPLYYQGLLFQKQRLYSYSDFMFEEAKKFQRGVPHSRLSKMLEQSAQNKRLLGEWAKSLSLLDSAKSLSVEGADHELLMLRIQSEKSLLVPSFEYTSWDSLMANIDKTIWPDEKKRELAQIIRTYYFHKEVELQDDSSISGNQDHQTMLDSLTKYSQLAFDGANTELDSVIDYADILYCKLIQADDLDNIAKHAFEMYLKAYDRGLFVLAETYLWTYAKAYEQLYMVAKKESRLKDAMAYLEKSSQAHYEMVMVGKKNQLQLNKRRKIAEEKKQAYNSLRKKQKDIEGSIFGGGIALMITSALGLFLFYQGRKKQMISKHLDEVKQMNQDLASANQKVKLRASMAETFSKSVNHDLSRYTNRMKMHMLKLKSVLTGMERPVSTEKIDKAKGLYQDIADQLSRMENIQEGMGELLNLDPAENFIEVDLGEVMISAAQEFKNKNILVRGIGKWPVIKGNFSQLVNAFVILADNAFLHGGREDIQVLIYPELGKIVVQDDGGLLDPQMFQKYLLPHVRGDKSKGKGYGLAIAFITLKNHGYNLSCEVILGQTTRIIATRNLTKDVPQSLKS